MTTLTSVAFQLVTGRVWKGCAFGGVKGRSQMGWLIDEYRAGRLKVDEFVTASDPLKDINKAFADMKSGEAIRTVLDMRQV